MYIYNYMYMYSRGTSSFGVENSKDRIVEDSNIAASHLYVIAASTHTARLTYALLYSY